MLRTPTRSRGLRTSLTMRDAAAGATWRSLSNDPEPLGAKVLWHIAGWHRAAVNRRINSPLSYDDVSSTNRLLRGDLAQKRIWKCPAFESTSLDFFPPPSPVSLVFHVNTLRKLHGTFHPSWEEQSQVCFLIQLSHHGVICKFWAWYPCQPY